MKGLQVDHEFNDGQASPPRAAGWRKSSYSNPSGNCVEAAELSAGVALRDSRFPDGPALAFPGAAWAAFVGRVQGTGPRPA